MQKVQEVVSRFGTKEDGKCRFAFATAYRLGAEPERCWKANVPTLSLFDLTYGEGTSKAIVTTYLAALNKAVGAKHEMDAFTMNICAEGIVDSFAHLKLSEMVLFFWRLIHGKYREADFYGTVDTQKIFKAVSVFMQERNKALYRMKQEQQEYDRTHGKPRMTRAEYEAMIAQKAATTAQNEQKQ